MMVMCRYVPIIPMILINGADGEGSDWGTKVPSFNPRDVVKNLLLMLDGSKPLPMTPWYRGTLLFRS